MQCAASLLTPPTRSAIAVVRLSGPGVGRFLARRFSRRAVVGRAVHGVLRDEAGTTLDDPVVVLCDPETADVNLHGGRYVVRAVLDLAARDGFEVRSPEPDGPTVLWREVLAALPTAPTPDAVRMLMAQPAAWATVADRDDPDQRRAILDDRSGHWMLNPPTVALVGPPNVGKSTLANQLFGQPRSITADAPGTTRDWVGGVADVGGLAVLLVDTPGVRHTADPIESAAIAGAVEPVRSAELTILVLDRSRPQGVDARAMRVAHPTAVRVANQSDRPAAWADADAIATVATTGDGVDRLRAAIRRHFGCEPIDPARPRWWTESQRTRLERGGSG